MFILGFIGHHEWNLVFVPAVYVNTPSLLLFSVNSPGGEADSLCFL